MHNETLDYYDYYASDIVITPTAFGAPDSVALEDQKARDERFYSQFDVELLTELTLLPGVNADTKLVDGSVRYYGTWKVTRSATDSTEARSGEMKSYTSYDFNEEGKIVYEQFYGDFGGLFEYLMDEEDDVADAAE